MRITQLLPVLSIAACVLALENEGQAAPEAVGSVERRPAAEPDAVPAGLPVSFSRPDVDQPASELLETEVFEETGTDDEWDDLTLRKDKKKKKRIKKKFLPQKYFMIVHLRCMDKCTGEGGSKKQCQVRRLGRKGRSMYPRHEQGTENSRIVACSCSYSAAASLIRVPRLSQTLQNPNSTARISFPSCTAP
ncbi:predicted protein [Verticillium alfalfae VaMs.102]|uniref:Predicted protein n=1 Tax=Verticillium alfalfae (strain VaMs.102 / ATCC MYA-4576 / FGSC 10136) TaxID=526221 RepID=C9SX87_VERA1|nr:predicted protein [Verticillium alfalfae VaMs.102]EEY23277.1 predicted protein [Verticillium alfalfae VaMs.102]